MQSLSRGWSFLQQAWQMAFKDKDLIKPSIYALFAGLFVSVLGLIPIVGALGGLIDTVWTEAAFLLLPAMVIEDISLSNALKRVGQITKNNLLLIGVSAVGVKWITGLIGTVLGLIGLVTGFAVGGGLIALFGSSTASYAIGIALGFFIFFAFAMVASVIGSYTGTAYHTCLYLWARGAEKARAAGQPVRMAVAPAPLAAVLSS